MVLLFVVCGWREEAVAGVFLRTYSVHSTYVFLCTRATISLFRAKPTVLFRVVVSFGVARITFHVYVDLYHALTRKKYARNFYYCGFWRTFSCRPTSLLLFYSMISCEGELRNGKKYAELAYFMTISLGRWTDPDVSGMREAHSVWVRQHHAFRCLPG